MTRIAIDLTQIPVKKVGVGMYGLNLVRELRELDQQNEYWLLVQDDDSELLALSSKRFHVTRVPARIFRILPFRLLLEQLYIPWLVWRQKIDVVHSLHYSFPLFAPAVRVVTVHDMTMFLMPELHLRSKSLYGRTFTRLAARFADRLSFDSESSRVDFLEVFPEAREKSFVVYLGCSKEFSDGVPQEAVTKVRATYGISGPYVLFVGTLEPRKNISTLVQAFAKVKDRFPEHRLVLTGKKGWHYAPIFELLESLGLKERVIFTGFIEESEKPALLRGADVFVYPSMYEGFGIPVIEAIACGTPTITSNVSSMPEVAGDAALLVTPSSTEEIARAIERLLADPACANELRSRCAAQAAKFRWRQTAEATLALYQDSPVR